MAQFIGNVTVFLDALKFPLLPKYQVHDTLHVLAGYSTTPLEELKLQAFMIGNKSSTFPGKVLFAFGLLIKPEYWTPLKNELQQSRNADQIIKHDFLLLVNENTNDVRRRLKIRD